VGVQRQGEKMLTERMHRSALAAIVEFHSTIVMNVITFFGVVALYNDLTRRGIGWVNMAGELTVRDKEWKEKYERRGFRLFSDSRLGGEVKSHVCGQDTNCSLTVRDLFDEGVGVMVFPQFRETNVGALLERLEPVFRWRSKGGRCFRERTSTGGWIQVSSGVYEL
jgi:hypothetical protein